MKPTEERQRLRKQLMDLRVQEAIRRHLADRQPEEYQEIKRQIKVVRRKMAAVSYEEKKKGR